MLHVPPGTLRFLHRPDSRTTGVIDRLPGHLFCGSGLCTSGQIKLRQQLSFLYVMRMRKCAQFAEGARSSAGMTPSLCHRADLLEMPRCPLIKRAKTVSSPREYRHDGKQCHQVSALHTASCQSSDVEVTGGLCRLGRTAGVLPL